MGKARPRKKGYRQGHLKRFHGEAINAGDRFNPTAVADHYSVYNGRLRVRSMLAGMSQSQTAPPKQSAVLNLEPEDIVVVRLRELWPKDYWPKRITFNRISLLLTDERNLFLFFAQQTEMFFFVAEYPKKKEVKRSIVYPSRRIAYMHMDAGKICWIEKKDLKVPLLDGLPPR